MNAQSSFVARAGVYIEYVFLCAFFALISLILFIGVASAQGLGSYTFNGADQFFTLDVGLSPIWNKEDRNYFRNNFASSNAYNTDYDYKDTGLRLRIRPYYKSAPSSAGAMELEGDFSFGLSGDRDVSYFSEPIAGPITQDFSNTYGDFRWEQANLFLAGVHLLGSDAAVTGRYDFSKNTNSRDWGIPYSPSSYRICRR